VGVKYERVKSVIGKIYIVRNIDLEVNLNENILKGYAH
jgi:hypothetical protein